VRCIYSSRRLGVVAARLSLRALYSKCYRTYSRYTCRIPQCSSPMGIISVPFPTVVQLLIGKPFSCTSDGSVRFLREGSFGWALSLNDGDKLAHCSGPVFGSKPTSYRAEGYGLLPMIRFLIRLSEYCVNTQALNHCRMASDNSSLVDNVLDRQQPSQLLDELDPNAPDRSLHHMARAQPALVSDWDILNEIRVSLPQLPTTPTIQWV
jgi:hypothetical protein